MEGTSREPLCLQAPSECVFLGSLAGAHGDPIHEVTFLSLPSPPAAPRLCPPEALLLCDDADKLSVCCILFSFAAGSQPFTILGGSFPVFSGNQSNCKAESCSVVTKLARASWGSVSAPLPQLSFLSSLPVSL